MAELDVPLPILDRQIRAATARVDAAKRALPSEGEGRENPLAGDRRVSSRATWLALAEHPDPLARSMRPHVARLVLERVLWDDVLRTSDARAAELVVVDDAEVGRGRTSARSIAREILAERSPVRRDALARALAAGSAHVADAARLAAERRREAARQLGVDLDELELPAPRDVLIDLAERVLVETADASQVHELDRRGARAGWHVAIAASLGRDATEGWPARLGARWLYELVHPTGLVDGLRLGEPHLPRALGAASFARALGELGALVADADGPTTSFCASRAPWDLRRARRSALFAWLAADPTFHRRALGLGAGRALDQSRVVGRAMLLSLRLAAARVLARGAVAARDRHRFEDAMARALGAEIPASLLGVFPIEREEAALDLVGALVALADRAELVDRFDEDWFRSPHAARAIRDEDAGSGPRAFDADVARQAVARAASLA